MYRRKLVKDDQAFLRKLVCGANAEHGILSSGKEA